MKIINLISIFFLSACGPIPDFVTDYGMEVWDKYGLSKEERGQLDTGVSLLLTALRNDNLRTKRFTNHLEMSSIIILPEPFDCSANQGCQKAAGEFDQYNYRFVIAVLNEECPIGTSAYIHELIHGFIYFRNVSDSNDGDFNHSNPRYWGENGFEGTVGVKFQNKVCTEVTQ